MLEKNPKIETWFMRQAGRYLPEYRAVREKAGGFLNLCFNPEQACEVTLQPIRRFDFDTAIIFSDILTIPFSLGKKVEILENKGGPQVEKIENASEINRLPTFNLEKLAAVLEAIRLTRAALPENKRLIGFCGAPWTLAVYMLQGRSSPNNEVTHRFAYREKEAFDQLISILQNAIADYLIAQIDAGCDTVQLFDSWAVFLAEETFERYVLNPAIEIVKKVKTARPKARFIAFPRGAGSRLQEYAYKVKADVIGCDTSVTIEGMREIQKIAGAQGNLDPNLLVVGGKALEERVKKLKTLKETGDYIFNLGHGITPETPIEHVETVLNLIRG